MKNALTSAVLFFGLAANVAYADTITDQVISELTAQGYQQIEIHNSPTEIRVEATKDGRVLEVVYDAVTGEVLSQEISSADQSDNEPNSGIDSSDDNDVSVEAADDDHEDADHEDADHEDADHEDYDHEDADHEDDDHEDDDHEDDDHEDDSNDD